MVLIFIFGNLKDCLMKILQLLLQLLYYSSYLGTKTRVEFKESCLKQDRITYDHGKVANIYIAYEISKNYDTSSYRTLENCLFGALALAKNSDIDK